MQQINMEIPEQMKGPLVQNMLATFWVSTVLGFIEKADILKELKAAGMK